MVGICPADLQVFCRAIVVPADKIQCVTKVIPLDKPGSAQHADKLYRNRGDGTFADVTARPAAALDQVREVMLIWTTAQSQESVDE